MICEQLTQTNVVKWAFVLGSTATIATQEIPIPTHNYLYNNTNLTIDLNEPYDNTPISTTQINRGLKYVPDIGVMSDPVVIMPKLNKKIKVRINRDVSPMKFVSIENSDGFIV